MFYKMQIAPNNAASKTRPELTSNPRPYAADAEGTIGAFDSWAAASKAALAVGEAAAKVYTVENPLSSKPVERRTFSEPPEEAGGEGADDGVKEAGWDVDWSEC